MKSASKTPRAAPRRLLRAVRTAALDAAEDDDVPNTVRLDDILREAARQTARSNPEHPLDQALNRKVLWKLFRDLGAAGLGRARVGRHGQQTRFEFNSNASCKGLRLVLDELLPSQSAPSGSVVSAREHALTASLNLEQPVPVQSLDRDSVVAALREHEEQLRQLGVLSLSLFGSVARNQARPDSDVDVLITFREPITSEAFFGTKFFLEDLLGRRVDLLTEAALRDRVRQRIEAELVRVA